MNVMKFIAENSFHATLCIGCKETNVEEMFNTIFLGLKIDNHLNCKNHTEKMISKWHGTCYAVSLLVHSSNINTLKSIYCA